MLVEWCCMCGYNGETMEHLLLHCSVVFELWSFVFGSFGFQWVLPEKVNDLCWFLLNYQLFQKFKLLEYSKFNHLTIQF